MISQIPSQCLLFMLQKCLIKGLRKKAVGHTVGKVCNFLCGAAFQLNINGMQFASDKTEYVTFFYCEHIIS